jgi:hypothetical protein
VQHLRGQSELVAITASTAQRHLPVVSATAACRQLAPVAAVADVCCAQQGQHVAAGMGVTVFLPEQNASILCCSSAHAADAAAFSADSGWLWVEGETGSVFSLSI